MASADEKTRVIDKEIDDTNATDSLARPLDPVSSVDEVLRQAESLSPAERMLVIARLSASMSFDGEVLPRLHHSQQSKIYSVPRRFDLATIFVVTAAYSLLLGTISGFGGHPLISLGVGGFITMVGLGQALLFGGQKPRLASVLVGTVCYFLPIIIMTFVAGPSMPRGILPWMLLQGVVFAPVFGYFAGVLVGGVFLVADLLRWMIKLRSEPSADDTVESE